VESKGGGGEKGKIGHSYESNRKGQILGPSNHWGKDVGREQGKSGVSLLNPRNKGEPP